MSNNNFRFSPAGKQDDWAALKSDMTILIKAQNPAMEQSFYGSLASELDPENYPYYTNTYKSEITGDYLIEVSISDNPKGLHHGFITFCLPEFLQSAKNRRFLHNNSSQVFCYKICSANSSAFLSIFDSTNHFQKRIFHLQSDPDDRIYVDTSEDPYSYSQHITLDNKNLAIYENSKNKYLGVNVVSVTEQRNVTTQNIEILQINFCYSEYNNQAITEIIIDLLSFITGDNMWFALRIQD